MIPVQYIISTAQNLPILTHAQAAIQAGCQWIQLQTTGDTGKELIEAAKKIKELCREHEAAFVIENNIELVKEIEADGVHLTNGMSVMEARQQLGEGFLIGINAKTSDEIITHKQQSADYISCGPFRSTADTVADDEGISVENYQSTMETLDEKGITLPVCAFGTIQTEDVPTLLQTGVRGIAIKLAQGQIDETLVASTLKKYIHL